MSNLTHFRIIPWMKEDLTFMKDVNLTNLLEALSTVNVTFTDSEVTFALKHFFLLLCQVIPLYIILSVYIATRYICAGNRVKLHIMD